MEHYWPLLVLGLLFFGLLGHGLLKTYLHYRQLEHRRVSVLMGEADEGHYVEVCLQRNSVKVTAARWAINYSQETRLLFTGIYHTELAARFDREPDLQWIPSSTRALLFKRIEQLATKRVERGHLPAF